MLARLILSLRIVSLLFALLAGAVPLVAQPAAPNDEVSAAGEPGRPGAASRIVQVTMRDSDGKLTFDPALIEVKEGEQIRFVITNAGDSDHEFFLGDAAEISEHEQMMEKMPDMEEMSSNAVRLKPAATGEILWRFIRAGQFEYACLLPGHREAGMIGKVIVK